jgi:hypothetical protein
MAKTNRTKSYRENKLRKKINGDGDKDDNKNKNHDCMKRIPILLTQFLNETINPEKRTLFNVRGCGTNILGIKKLNKIDVGGLKKIFQLLQS